MNPDPDRQKLLDLLYGELDAAAAQALRRRLRDSAELRAEYERLCVGKAAADAFAAGEPADAPPTPAAGGRALSWRRWPAPAAAAAAAAAALIALAVWMLHGPTTKKALATGPPEIVRTAVSITILSEPAHAGPGVRTGQMPEAQMAQVGRLVRRPAINAPYQADQMGHVAWPWSGLALVRDKRVVRRLDKGVTEVRFADVPAGIVPDSVRLRGLDHPGGLAVLEQNYQYDLASAAAVLERYVDRPVGVTPTGGGPVIEGHLLSFDADALAIRPSGEGPRTIPRDQVRAVRLARLPRGLLTRPTLLWHLENRAARRQRFEVVYLTRGLTWRADYVLKLRAAERPAGGGEPQAPQITDTADLVGYATVTNDSGVTFEDAELKLMAGDLHLVMPPRALFLTDGSNLADQEYEWRAGVPFREKAFFEYHLYTLGRRTTLRSAETKQITLVTGGGLKLRRGYVFDRTQNATAARVVSELNNTKANGLGKPLPKGVVRLYAPGPDGRQTYAARTTIDHTPADEMLRLPWGHAFDIACSAKKLRHERPGGDTTRETWRYRLASAKDYGVTVTVIARVPRSTFRATCSHRWGVREVGVVEIEVPLPAGEAATVSFQYSYNPARGGGLTSPHEKTATHE
jgi:hypothetical protein